MFATGCIVKSFVLLSLIVSAAVGCSSAVTSPGTLAPGQIDAQDPSAPNADFSAVPPPPTDPSTGNPNGPMDGCPSVRPLEETPATELASVDDFRERVAGIYRTCLGNGMALEVRIDPKTNRVQAFELDSRFVRKDDNGLTGSFEVVDCTSATCNIVWYFDSDPTQPYEGTIVMWTDPIALEVRLPSTLHSRQEWLRVAD